MKVQLLAYTPEPEKIVAAAAKLCYSNAVNVRTLMNGLSEENTKNFIEKLRSFGHLSPYEHANFTFAVEGVSRSLLAQISRHRIASLSVRSQRFCSEKNLEYIMPGNIKEDDAIYLKFKVAMADAKVAYNTLIEYGAKKEDARAVLPNACTTRFIITMNARSLINFFQHRCCNRAQDEIRELANEMLKLCKNVAPTLFKHAGASCDNLGYCPEGNMCCGKAPLLKDVLDAYNEKRQKEIKKI